MIAEKKVKNVYETPNARLSEERDRLRRFDIPTKASIAAIGSLEPGQLLLDIGAGNNPGLMTYANQQEARYIAMDINAESQREKVALGAVALQGDARHLPVKPASADVAHARFVLGHFTQEAEREQAVKQAFDAVKPGGKAVFIDYDWTVMDGSQSLRDLRDLTLNHVNLFDAAYGRTSSEEIAAILDETGTVETQRTVNEGLTDYAPVVALRQVTLMGLERSGADAEVMAHASSVFDALEAEASDAQPFRMPDIVATIIHKA